MQLTFSLLEGIYGIYQLPQDAPIPTPTCDGVWSFTRAENEVSILCPEGGCPHATRKSEGWVAIKLHGPFDFALTGIVAEVSRVLADAAIGVFIMSTYDTDYILVKQESRIVAIRALTAAGHQLATASN